MALAISFISENKEMFVVAFDNIPTIELVIDTIKDEISSNNVMIVVDWDFGFNFDMTSEYRAELIEKMNSIY